ncbi:MAG: cyanophycinase [Planctomycetota bacterium]
MMHCFLRRNPVAVVLRRGALVFAVIGGLSLANPSQAEPDPPRQADDGHLVIVGGGLQPDNEPIYRAVLDRIPDDGTLGVLPTASGVPEESGPGHVADFRQYAGPNQKIVLLDIRNGDVGKANDPAWAEKIKACDGLWFTGGDQSRIVATFRPDEGDTPAYAAMWDVLNRGGVIGGTSAGAAMMSDPMIKWGNSHEALLLGVVNDVPDFGVGVGKGMGFLPDAIVDQHFFARGRLGRLLVAMQHDYVRDEGRLGVGVGENSAFVFNIGFKQSPPHAIGPNGVLLVLMDEFEDRAPSALTLPALTQFLPDGAQATQFRSESTDGRPAIQEELEAWTAGAPRAYDGGLASSIKMLDQLNGYFEVISNDLTHFTREQTRAALDAERRKSAETEEP